MEENVPERAVDYKILQLHSKQIIHYNSIRAEDFIQNLERLWETNSKITEVKLTTEIEPDWLNYSIKLCNDKLPPLLSDLGRNPFEFKPENAINFFIYQEYELFNKTMRMVRDHLKNLEKYLLLNTQLFPREWKTIALSLQSQRVPEEWEHQNCRPSIHTLKSWIKSQVSIYRELEEIRVSKFLNINSFRASNFKNLESLFSSILVQKCIKNNWNIEDAELCFEIKEDAWVKSSLNIIENDSFLLKDIKIIGGSWDSTQKQIIASE